MQIPIFEFPPTISLSLSSVCNARCVWCPIGKRLNRASKNKFMTMGIVDKVLSDCHGKEIYSILIADMGEPLLNPDFKEIVIKIRKAHPEAKMLLSSNFFLMDEDMARFVIDNFQTVGLNIDGITDEGYYAVKHLPLKVVKGNFLNFLKLREESHKRIADRGIVADFQPIVNVAITSEPRYYMEIGEPEKATVPDETRRVSAFLRNVLEMNDGVNETVTATWAERRKWNRARDEQNICSNFLVHLTKCCIDTNGNVIPCCLDYDSECVLGNIMEKTIEEIWNGEVRRRFTGNLSHLRYESIGLPCSICHD